MSLKRLIPAVIVIAVAAGCGQKGKTLTQREAATDQWNSARAGVLFGLARQQYETGNFDACRKSIDDALAMEPTNVQLHILSAKLSIEQGKLEPALKELQAAGALDEKNPEIDYFTGVVYQRWQKPDLACAAYTKACEKKPTELAYLLARSEMLVAMDRLGEALAGLQEKMSFFENSAAIRDAVGQLLVQQAKYAQAIPVLRQASILAPDEPSIREHLGLAHYYGKQYRDAMLLIEPLLNDTRYASRTDLRSALGECQLQAGQSREARETFEQLARQDPGSAASWLGLGKAALQCGDLKRADLAVRKALVVAPQNADAQVLLGYVRLRENKLDEALLAFRKASALDERDPVSLCMAGYVLEKQGKSAQAAQLYAKALRVKPDDELASSLMAQVQLQD